MPEPMVRTGDANVAQRTTTFAAAVMLRHAVPVMILEKTATSVQMPRNKGSKISWRRPVPFTAATAPLVEGITPTGRKIEFENIEAVLKQYGDYSRYSDQIADLHEDPVGSVISTQHGENIGRTWEALNWGVVRGGTNVFFANGAARTAVNTAISLGKQRLIVQSLKKQKAMKYTQILSGSPNYSTFPIEAAYIAVAHTDVESDIRNLAGFVPVAQYGSRATISPEEIGSVEEVRYLTSPDLDFIADAGGARGTMRSTSGTSADVYPIVYFGKDAWATVALRGREAITVLHKTPGTASDSDPLGQRGLVSWKGYHVARVLNENWMARLEVAVTAL